MAESRKYGKTLVACYLGFITQAIAANFAPLLFVTFQHTYGISLEKIALIPVVFYLTQLFVDLGATKFADKIGYRICVVASQIVSAIGLVCWRFSRRFSLCPSWGSSSRWYYTPLAAAWWRCW